jgi:hypothetical protein
MGHLSYLNPQPMAKRREGRPVPAGTQKRGLNQGRSRAAWNTERSPTLLRDRVLKEAGITISELPRRLSGA